MSEDAPTYDITTVKDFLAIPEDRIDACLRDFAAFLRCAPAWASLLGHISDEMHGKSAIAFEALGRFRWIDDDADTMTMSVVTPDGSQIESFVIEAASLSPDEP